MRRFPITRPSCVAHMLALVAGAALVPATVRAQSAGLPPAIYADPPQDTAHPARMKDLHIPAGDVKINGVAYLAAGVGTHPTFVLLHGLPGYEKNLDLAQAVRRDGWNTITFDYRGSWGSPGDFRFAHSLEDAAAVLAYVRQPANAKALGVDTSRLVLAGHSMGGWVTVLTAARDHHLAGAVFISASNIGLLAHMKREDLVKFVSSSSELLAGVTPASMADEVATNGGRWTFAGAYSGLASMPLLVITSNDGLAQQNDLLVAAVRRLGNTRVTTARFPTDHSYSGQRIAMESAVLRWLEALPH